MPNTLKSSLLTPKDYRFLALCSAIIVVAVFNFMVFWHNAQSIILSVFEQNHLPLNSHYYLLILLALGYVSRPVGAFFMGIYGDRSGRKPVVLICLLLLSIVSLLNALLPAYSDIGRASQGLFCFLRVLQGLFFAPILPTLWVLSTEHLPVKHIGFGTGILSASIIVGILLLVLTNLLLQELLSFEMMIAVGYRIIFLIGALFGAVVLYFVRHLDESPLFNTKSNFHQENISNQELTTATEKTQKITLFGSVTIVLILSWFMSAVFVILVILLKDLSALSFQANENLLTISYLFLLIFFAIGSVFFGFLIDRINSGIVYMIALSLLMVALFGLFYDLRDGGKLILFSFSVAGFFAGISSITPLAMTRFSPSKYRLSLFSVSYNIVWALTGMTTPILIGFLSFYNELAPAVYLCLLCILAIFIGFYLYENPRQSSDHI